MTVQKYWQTTQPDPNTDVFLSREEKRSEQSSISNSQLFQIASPNLFSFFWNQISDQFFIYNKHSHMNVFDKIEQNNYIWNYFLKYKSSIF